MTEAIFFSSVRRFLSFPFRDSEKKGRFAVGIVLMLAVFFAYLTSFFSVAFDGINVAPAGVVVSFALMLFGMFASVVFNVLRTFSYPATITRIAIKDRFVAVFDMRAWWPVLHRYLTNYLVLMLLVFGLVGFMYVAYLLMYVTVCLCFIAIFLHPLAMYAICLIPPSLLADISPPALLLAENPPGDIAIPPEFC